MKTAAPKRHSTPVHRSVTMRSPESKRKPVLSANKKEDSGSVSHIYSSNVMLDSSSSGHDSYLYSSVLVCLSG